MKTLERIKPEYPESEFVSNSWFIFFRCYMAVGTENNKLAPHTNKHITYLIVLAN